jgi:hypothetical protein
MGSPFAHVSPVARLRLAARFSIYAPLALFMLGPVSGISWFWWCAFMLIDCAAFALGIVAAIGAKVYGDADVAGAAAAGIFLSGLPLGAFVILWLTSH